MDKLSVVVYILSTDMRNPGDTHADSPTHSGDTGASKPCCDADADCATIAGDERALHESYDADGATGGRGEGRGDDGGGPPNRNFPTFRKGDAVRAIRDVHGRPAGTVGHIFYAGKGGDSVVVRFRDGSVANILVKRADLELIRDSHKADRQSTVTSCSPDRSAAAPLGESCGYSEQEPAIRNLDALSSASSRSAGAITSMFQSLAALGDSALVLRSELAMLSIAATQAHSNITEMPEDPPTPETSFQTGDIVELTRDVSAPHEDIAKGTRGRVDLGARPGAAKGRVTVLFEGARDWHSFQPSWLRKVEASDAVGAPKVGRSECYPETISIEAGEYRLWVSVDVSEYPIGEDCDFYRYVIHRTEKRRKNDPNLFGAYVTTFENVDVATDSGFSSVLEAQIAGLRRLHQVICHGEAVVEPNRSPGAPKVGEAISQPLIGEIISHGRYLDRIKRHCSEMDVLLLGELHLVLRGIKHASWNPNGLDKECIKLLVANLWAAVDEYSHWAQRPEAPFSAPPVKRLVLKAISEALGWEKDKPGISTEPAFLEHACQSIRDRVEFANRLEQKCADLQHKLDEITWAQGRHVPGGIDIRGLPMDPRTASQANEVIAKLTAERDNLRSEVNRLADVARDLRERLSTLGDAMGWNFEHCDMAGIRTLASSYKEERERFSWAQNRVSELEEEIGSIHYNYKRISKHDELLVGVAQSALDKLDPEGAAHLPGNALYASLESVVDYAARQIATLLEEKKAWATEAAESFGKYLAEAVAKVRPVVMATASGPIEVGRVVAAAEAEVSHCNPEFAVGKRVQTISGTGPSSVGVIKGYRHDSDGSDFLQVAFDDGHTYWIEDVLVRPSPPGLPYEWLQFCLGLSDGEPIGHVRNVGQALEAISQWPNGKAAVDQIRKAFERTPWEQSWRGEGDGFLLLKKAFLLGGLPPEEEPKPDALQLLLQGISECALPWRAPARFLYRAAISGLEPQEKDAVDAYLLSYRTSSDDQTLIQGFCRFLQGIEIGEIEAPLIRVEVRRVNGDNNDLWVSVVKVLKK